jgi:hypothetical protein
MSENAPGITLRGRVCKICFRTRGRGKIKTSGPGNKLCLITPSLFHLAFALLLAISVTVFWTPLRTIAALSWSDDRYSHLLLIPMISAFLLYFERARIFSQPTDRHGAAFSLLLGAATVYALSALRLFNERRLRRWKPKVTSV